ncbi:hypothetical protein KIN20_038145 [Parelaphostrongylus tenuis]|uniref:TGF-beta family profile domain-containing protein n=1 Tax=Parelaphostrongylus tenuis TaxID=148309 RepID=A0AAD5REW1_PARTN|nr:hypothetical protein KIN20_038145 [Parelaphostrongylus tenuis]
MLVETITLPILGWSSQDTMFMSVTLSSGAESRQKRSTLVCKPEDHEPGCCLYDLTVDFHQIGWKFIIAPHKYNAYMCKGDCSANRAHVSRSGHTRVSKTGIFTRQDATGVQTMCCHPSEYDAVRMIYMNGDNQVTMSSDTRHDRSKMYCNVGTTGIYPVIVLPQGILCILPSYLKVQLDVVKAKQRKTMKWSPQNEMLFVLLKRRENATEAACNINGTCGDDAIAERMARRCFAKVKAGEDSLEDQSRLGRPQEASLILRTAR